MSKIQLSRHIRAFIYSVLSLVLLLSLFFAISTFRTSQNPVPKSSLQKIGEFVWGSSDGEKLFSSYDLQDQIALLVVQRKEDILDQASIAKLLALSAWIDESLASTSSEIWTPKKLRKIFVSINRNQNPPDDVAGYENYFLKQENLSALNIEGHLKLSKTRNSYRKQSSLDFYILNNESKIELRVPLQAEGSFRLVKTRLSSLVSKQNLSYYLEFQSLMWKRNNGR